MPNLGSVTKFFPAPFENSLAMTLNGTIAPGATTVGVNNLGNYTNGQVVVFRIDSGTANAQVFTGTVSGSNIVNVVWTYGTNVAHTDGAAIVDYVSSTTVGMISKGILQQHNQDGTHGVVTSTGLTNVGALNQTGATSLNGSWDGWVGANESWTFASSTTITVPTDATTKYDVGDFVKLTQSATVKYFTITGVTATVLTVAGYNGVTVANSAITANAYSKAHTPHGVTGTTGIGNPYGPWLSWTPTWTTLTIGNAVQACKYIQVGKTITAKLQVTLGSTSSMATGVPSFTLPATAVSHLTASVLGYYISSSTVSTYGPISYLDTTHGQIFATETDTSYAQQNQFTATAPGTWGNGSVIAGTFTYEVA